MPPLRPPHLDDAVGVHPLGSIIAGAERETPREALNASLPAQTGSTQRPPPAARPGPPRALSLLHVVATGSRPPPFLETAATNQERPGGIVTSRRVPGAGTMGARARRSHVDRGRGIKKRTDFPFIPFFLPIFF